MSSIVTCEAFSFVKYDHGRFTYQPLALAFVVYGRGECFTLSDLDDRERLRYFLLDLRENDPQQVIASRNIYDCLTPVVEQENIPWPQDNIVQPTTPRFPVHAETKAQDATLLRWDRRDRSRVLEPFNKPHPRFENDVPTIQRIEELGMHAAWDVAKAALQHEAFVTYYLEYYGRNPE